MLNQKLHKTVFLLKLLGILMLFLLVHRGIFLVMFYHQFSDVSFIEFIKAFLIGALTDAIAILYFLLPMWLVLIFFDIEKKLTRTIALSWFTIGFVLTCLLNLSDLGYYPITKKRMGAELIDILPEVPALMQAYLKDYWYLFLLLIVFFLLAFYILKQQLINFKNNNIDSFKLKGLNVLVVLLLFFSIMRGGYGKHPFMPFDIPSYVDPKLQWLASNTPFQFLHTLNAEGIKVEKYYPEEEAEKIVELNKQFSSSGFQKKNILIILLESFGCERIGFYNPKVKFYTPFLDSLLANSRTYKYGMANGRMTIDALPSVLTGIPSFMEKNYCYSNYNNNMVNGLSVLLGKQGYQTAFFYGGLKSTFGFENFINLNFSKTYISQEDYTKPYENSGWGVDDHLYLPFVASKLKELKQPFCASLLTLSLHHPFPIPEPYKTLFDTIKNPIKKSMMYTDVSLKLFFDEIKKADWYKNSIIALCADHTSTGFDNFEDNQINMFGIPISFLVPGDSVFNKVQDKSISQIDMYPTILDYLGYNNSFVSLGNSALNKSAPTIQYGGNGMFVIFEFPYVLEYDNSEHKVTKFYEFTDARTIKDLGKVDSLQSKSDELLKKVKAYIQVFSYRVNKNQF